MSPTQNPGSAPNDPAPTQTPVTVPPTVVERWRKSLNEAKRDQFWQERQRMWQTRRRAVLPEIADLVKQFLDAKITLPNFRETFDRKTRNEWDVFGLKGLSGAMFLNKLVKHLPAHDTVSTQLRAAIQSPAETASAHKQISDFLAFLNQQIQSGTTTVAELQPRRVAFFLSACWHMQSPQQWPIVYQSARTKLETDGLIARNLQDADGYLEFARMFRSLADALGIPFWDLEHLCLRDGLPIEEPGRDRQPGVEPEDLQKPRLWLIAPGPGAERFNDFYQEGIVAIGWDYLGDLSKYGDMEEIRKAIQEQRGGNINPSQDALACHQFAHEMKVGDIVFAKRGRKEIVGYGLVASAYRHEPRRRDYSNVRSVEWKKRGEWVPRERPLVMKTLTEIGKYPALVADIYRALEITEGDAPVAVSTSMPALGYTVADAVEELFVSRPQIEDALELLRYKKNIVLQGPPGVGKTFFAKRLAYLLLGEKDNERLAQVQFHQSYSYEDFVQGYRPNDDGKFTRVDGPFMRFCDKALQDSNAPYVMIIDEINRGNLSKILGELLLLIEVDKRNETWATALTYGREGEQSFYVPQNVHLIGTMNTADRSLAVVDYALRRRFAFLDIPPGFGETPFAQKLGALGATPVLRDRIIARLERLNDRIRGDANLGDGFCIGHSYFCHVGGGAADEAWYRRIVRTEIEPLLREYWFDDTERSKEEVARLLDDD